MREIRVSFIAEDKRGRKSDEQQFGGGRDRRTMERSMNTVGANRRENDSCGNDVLEIADWPKNCDLQISKPPRQREATTRY